MLNSIEFVSKGKSAKATDLPKPIGAYASSWGKTDKLNVGVYNVPSSSNREKFNTYRVVALKAQAQKGKAKATKQTANAPEFSNALAKLCKQYGVKL